MVVYKRLKTMENSIKPYPQKEVAVAYEKCSFTTVSNCSQLCSVCSDLTVEILVFWIDGRLWVVVAYDRRFHIEAIYLFIYQLFWTQAFLEGMYTNVTQVPYARCHPYSIPQPVKVGHTTGVYDPYSFRIVMWVLLRPTRTVKSVKVL